MMWHVTPIFRGGLCLQWYVHTEQWRLRCDIYALCGASYGCMGALERSSLRTFDLSFR
jgi:hypothetical protein